MAVETLQASPAAMRVLSIEDAPDYARLVDARLQRALPGQLELTSRSSVAEARDALRSHSFDCVLLDLSLPDATGLHALFEVLDVAPDVPVVVLSADESDTLAMQAVRAGAQDYVMKDGASGERLSRAIRYAVERRQSELELARQALRDPLTGLPNRSALQDRLGVALARVDPPDRMVAVLFIDLDAFKVVNDELGHKAGDELLRTVGARIAASVRATDTVARFGGDEFVVLCENLGAEWEVEALVERLEEAIAEAVPLGRSELSPQASIGVSIARDRDISPERLVEEADRDMYRHKRDKPGDPQPDLRDGDAAFAGPTAEAGLGRVL